MTGAASRPIAGKRGSHRYSACLKAGDIPVRAGLPAMRPALTTELWISVRLGSIAASHDRLLRPIAVVHERRGLQFPFPGLTVQFAALFIC